MKQRKPRTKHFAPKIFATLCSIFLIANLAFAQSNAAKPAAATEAQKAEASGLIDENRYIQALPIFEKIASSYQTDAEFLARYGVAIISNSVTLTTPEARKTERIRGIQILEKARKLGSNDIKALDMLERFPSDGGEDDNFSSDNPAVERALREGEAFFGRAEYDKAFAAYEKAYKLNPKSYEAVLFMGDSLYAQKKYKESEVWFARAVAIEPNREMAHRFWGDALLAQGKNTEARDRFIEGLIAEPFARISWESLSKWSDIAQVRLAPIEIMPPNGDVAGEIVVDEKLLKTEDGTIHWKLFKKTRDEQLLGKLATNQRYTLADELVAWEKTAEAARIDLKAGKLKYPDKSIVNLIKLDDAGALEPYILFLRPREDFEQDFFDYRKKNRDKLKRFVVEFIIGAKI